MLKEIIPIATIYRISNTDHPYFNKRVEVQRIHGKDTWTTLEDDDFCQVRLLGTDILIWLWAFELRILEETLDDDEILRQELGLEQLRPPARWKEEAET